MATIVHQLRGSSPEGRVRPAAKGVCRMRAGHAEELLSHLTQPLIRRGCLTHEIGRASCRERVESEVVAVAMKRERKTDTGRKESEGGETKEDEERRRG